MDDSLSTNLNVSIMGLICGAVFVIALLHLLKAVSGKDYFSRGDTAAGKPAHSSNMSYRSYRESFLNQPLDAHPYPKQDESSKAGCDSHLRDRKGPTDNDDCLESSDTSIESSQESDTSSWTTGEEEESESMRMEELNLKMILVVHQGPGKPLASEVARLAVTAAVGLVEKFLVREDGASQDAAPVMDEWLLWYKWWNRLGCGKIVVKCPQRDVLDGVLSAAEADGLPFYVTWQQAPSQLPSRQGHRTCGGCAATATVNNLKKAPEMGEVGEGVVVVALGPSPSSRLSPITGHLKLY
ncbi:unnamed protein product [Phytomonas sp. EM1]|nr:unnamed protein product [Phytomonas sp. EM1]|eukprot:CCW61594.1 unnamed protein product [Phytomonas sp. isolate EM1]